MKKRYYIENITVDGSHYLAGDDRGYASEAIAKGTMKALNHSFPDYRYRIITRTASR